MSSWIIFNTETVAKLKEKQGIDHQSAFVKSSQIWKTLSEKDKKPFADRSKKDEVRYQKQLKDLKEKGFFTTESGIKSTDIEVDPKKKYGKDAVLPKKSMSSYLYFTQEQVNKIKEKEKCTHLDAMRKAGEIWNKMMDKEKKKYGDMVAKDQNRYYKQLAELNKKGFFILEDGTKSSDYTNGKKGKRQKKPVDDETDDDSEMNMNEKTIKRSKIERK